MRGRWASTSTKNPAYPDTLYVDSLIGPDTVNTLPESTIAAFEDHGTIARTMADDADHAGAVMDRLAEVGVDMDDVGRTSRTRAWPASTSRSPTSSRHEQGAPAGAR